MSDREETKRRPIVYSETRTAQEWRDMLAAMPPLEMREFQTQLREELNKHSPGDNIRVRVDPFL